MKILCYINHFFGQNKTFIGKSSLTADASNLEIQERKKNRKEIVEKVISELKLLGDIDIKICGLKGNSLIQIDIDFSESLKNPTFLIYASIERMASEINNYDYFINIEDDILLTSETFQNIIQFDKISLLNELLHPNRMERKENSSIYCVDLYAMSGWTLNRKKIFNREFGIAYNPHSALMILSREKFQYALRNTDLKANEVFFAHAMESAFANVHRPFLLWRCFSEQEFHCVYHLDRWKIPDKGFFFLIRKMIQILSWNDFIPPIVMKVYRYLKRK